MNCYRIHQKSLNFIYPSKFYSNFTNKNVSGLHFRWATQYMYHNKGGKRKRIYIAPLLEYLTLKALRYGSHSVTCKLHRSDRTCLYLVSIHQMAHPRLRLRTDVYVYAYVYVYVILVASTPRPISHQPKLMHLTEARLFINS